MPEGTPIDIDKLRSLAVVGKRTRDVVREYRRDDGVRCKATTDELGNTVTEHNVKGDRQDVQIRPQTIKVSMEELRRGAK